MSAPTLRMINYLRAIETKEDSDEEHNVQRATGRTHARQNADCSSRVACLAC